MNIQQTSRKLFLAGMFYFTVKYAQQVNSYLSDRLLEQAKNVWEHLNLFICL